MKTLLVRISHLFSSIFIFLLIFIFLDAHQAYGSQPIPTEELPQNGEAALLALPDITTQFSGCGGTTAPIVNEQFEQRIVELVNAERALRSLPPLKRLSQLDQAARYHAMDMAQDNYFDHDTYDLINGSLQMACAWSSRIAAYYTGWSTLGENIAAGYVTPEDVMNGWMSSQGHRENILRASFTEIGVGYFEGAGSYARYWVQDFGNRYGVYPLIINQEAASTTNRAVSLYVYGAWTEVRLRNDNDAWSAWMPFQNSITWQLPAISGDHTVSAEMRNSVASASSSDTIHLDLPTQPQLGGLPPMITFTYSISSQELSPPSVLLIPQNVGDQAVLNWQITTQDSWIGLSTQTGLTPNPVTLTLKGFIKDTVATYNGAISIQVVYPSNVAGSPQTIPVVLNVIAEPFSKNYLPLIKAP